MAEGVAPETHGHLGPVQLPESIIFSQRLVDTVFDATGVRVYYRTREKWGKGYFWTLKGPNGAPDGGVGTRLHLRYTLELVCMDGGRRAGVRAEERGTRGAKGSRVSEGQSRRRSPFIFVPL